MNITQATKAKDIKRSWHLVDVKDKILGRMATRIADFLIGKTKPYWVPYLDCGDYVVVVNVKQVAVSGKKSSQKIYMRYSGYPGGETRKTYQQVLLEDPNRIILEAVSGMLPKNKLRASMLKRLYVFADDKHPYENKFEGMYQTVRPEARNPKS